MPDAATNKSVSPGEIQPSASVLPPAPNIDISNMITIYQVEGRALNKGYARDGDGVKNFPGTMTTEIRAHRYPVANIEELLAALRWSEAQPDTCASWSTPRPELDLSRPFGRAGNLIAGYKAWLPVDLDHLPMVPEQRVDIRNLAALDAIVAPLLPKPFRNVDRIIQATPSHGIEGKGARLRYWFMLNRPIVKWEALELLAGGDLTIGRVDKDTPPNIDRSLYDNGKYIYTGPPRLVDLADPMAGVARLLLIKDDRRHVLVPQYPRPQKPTPASNSIRMDNAAVDPSKLERVKSALHLLFEGGVIAGDGTYPEWMKVAFALLSGFEEDLAYDLFASVSPDLAGKDQKCWNDFVTRDQARSATDAKIGLGTLFKMARDAGWQDPHPHLPSLESLFSSQTVVARQANDNSRFHSSKWCMDNYPRERPVRKQLVEDLFPMEKVSLLAAAGGAGKSMLLLDLALSVATGKGRPSALMHEDAGPTMGAASPASEESILQAGLEPMAFGNRVLETGTVVIFAAEDDRDEILGRLFDLDPFGTRNQNPDRLRIVPLPDADGPIPLVQMQNNRMEKTGQYEAIRKDLAGIEDLKLIVFDPLASFFQVDVNADPMAGNFVIGMLASLAKETGAAVILAHHMRKPSGNTPISSVEQARNAIRGTSALVDGARFVYALWPAPDKDKGGIVAFGPELADREVFLGATVKGNGPAEKKVRTFARDGETGLLVDVTARLEKSGPQKVDFEAALIEGIANAAGKGAPMNKTGTNGVFKRLCEMPPVLQKMPRTKMEKLVDTALQSGKLVKLDSQDRKNLLDVPDGLHARGEGVQVSGQSAE